MNAAPPGPADPGYLATLGLQWAPFLDRIDDRFFYADPVLVQRLDLLQHLTQFGDMLLGVIGPAGSGKSTLLQQFIARGGAAWRCCRISGAQTASVDELLARLCAGFAVDVTADQERTKAALLRQFQSLRHATQLPVILIDDAEQLPDPILKALLALGGSARETLKLVRIVLFAAPGLEQKLIQAGLHSPQQPLLHSLEMPLFDIQQSAAYLMYRLAVAGYSGDSPFSLTEIRALHKAAEGLPGKLNVLAHETLMERAGRIAARNKAGAGAPAVPAARAKRLALLGGLAGLAALTWYLLQSGLPTLPDTTPEPPPEMALAPAARPIEAAPEPPEATAPADESPAGDAESDAAAPQNEAPAQADTSTAGTAGETAAAPTPEPVLPDTQTADSLAVADTAAGPDSSAAAEPTALSAAPTAPADSSADTPAATVSAETSAPEPTPASAALPIAAAAEPAPPAPEPTTAGASSATAPAQDESPAATAAPEGSAAAAIHREDWLQQRAPTHYTLQLLGVRSEDSLRGYLDRHAPPDPVAYFRTDYKGGDWYVLVQGDYPSMAAARAAVAGLPAAIRKAKPWPRSFASVHADIEKAGAEN